MISSSIDGSQSDGSKQLFNLIDLISDPVAYNKKLKDLQDAIDKNQKLIDLVAPAKDILALKEKILADSSAASSVLSDAKDQAAKIISEAKEQAHSLVEDAKAQAKLLVDDTKKTNAEAKAKVSELKDQIAASKAAQESAEKAAADYQAQAAIAVTKQKELDDAKNSISEEKKKLVNAQKAFIESIS